MKLDNFILEEYNRFDNVHNEVLNTLYKDENAKKYLGNIMYLIERINQRKEEDKCNAFYIAFYNDEPVGHISLTKIEDSYQVSISILPNYRKQHMAALLTQEFSEKIFEKYPYIDKLDAIIDRKNIGSIKSALLAGYEEENNIYSQKRV